MNKKLISQLLVLCLALTALSASPAKENYRADSLTLQPGTTESSVNITWYSGENTLRPAVKFGDVIVKATSSDLHLPTLLNEEKYKDAGKVVNKATVTGLEPSTTYTYQVSDNGGLTWSEPYTFTTQPKDVFSFVYTSDPQIKENKSINDKGWNPEDGTNQTGWAKMVEVIYNSGVNLIVSAGDQVEDQSWGKSSEYDAFFAPKELPSLLYAPAVGNHDRHYMFEDHFNLPNEMVIAEDGTEGDEATLTQVKTSFRGQNSGTSQSHGNYIRTIEGDKESSNGVYVNADGYFDFTERREMETRGNYYFLYNNILFVTLNTGAYPGGNDAENAGNPNVPSAENENDAIGIVENFRKTLAAATAEYAGQYDWLMVTHHKSTQTVAKHVADSDIENYVDAGFETLMDEFKVDFVLGGHDHVYSRSYVLKGGLRTAEALDDYTDPDGTIYLTSNCASDMQYNTPYEKLDKYNNVDYPSLANGESGSEAFLKGVLPYGTLTWNQDYSPSYAIFSVDGKTISAKVYNLDGDPVNPESRLIDSFSVTKTK